MRAEPLSELALTPEEVDEILRRCDAKAVLVGGQALAVWAQVFDVLAFSDIGPEVTRDIDFLGSAQAASELANALRPMGWRMWKPSLDDVTPQTAKLSKRIEGEGIKQIDFLGSVVGLQTEDVRKRAVELELEGGIHVWIMHPLDVLESRLKNLAALPSKRDEHGVAQARLALQIIRAYLLRLTQEGSPRGVLDAIERLLELAQTKTLEAVLYSYDLNVLAVVPVDAVSSRAFKEKRWPQVLAHWEERRRRYLARANRAR